jgi:protein-tyrosine phosphatase
MISNVLTVCQGNVCRSPMAAALLQQKIEGVHVHSCGLAAMVGQPAASNAVAVLSEVGVDMREHRARQLTWQLASRADLILTRRPGDRTRQQGIIAPRFAGHGRLYVG